MKTTFRFSDARLAFANIIVTLTAWVAPNGAGKDSAAVRRMEEEAAADLLSVSNNKDAGSGEMHSNANEYNAAGKLWTADDLDEAMASLRAAEQAERQHRTLPENFGGAEISRAMRLQPYAEALYPLAVLASPDVFQKYAERHREDLRKIGPAILAQFDGMACFRRLACANRLRGDRRMALEIYEQEMKRCRGNGDRNGLAKAIEGYGLVLAVQGKLEDAEQSFSESLKLREQIGSAHATRSWLLTAAISALRDNREDAERLLSLASEGLMKGRFAGQFASEPVELPAFTLETRRRMRVAKALAPLTDLAWQFQADGSYSKAAKVAKFTVHSAERLLPPESGVMDDYERLYAQTLFADSRRDEAIRILAAIDEKAGAYWRERTWKQSYETAAFTFSGAIDTVNHDLAVSFGEADLLAKEILAWKNLAYRLTVAKRHALARSAATSPAALRWSKLVALRERDRDEVLTEHRGNDRNSSLWNEIFLAERKFAETLDARTAGRHASVEDIAAALPADAAYVDFVIADRWTEKTHAETEWAALVVRPGKPVRMAHCGKARSVRGQISRYRELARQFHPEKPRDSELEKASRELYTSVIAPVEALLDPGAKTIFICPDGPLALIGLGALLDGENQFWGEKREVRYVATGDALLRKSEEPAVYPKTVGLMGDPKFRIGKAPSVARRATPEETALKELA